MSKIIQIRHCHICQLPILASLDMVIFDVQTSCGCLKVSDFYQESDFEVDNHLRQCIQSENKLLCFCESLPCETEIWWYKNIIKVLYEDRKELFLKHNLNMLFCYQIVLCVSWLTSLTQIKIMASTYAERLMRRKLEDLSKNYKDWAKNSKIPHTDRQSDFLSSSRYTGNQW